jgi:hypothetical protein
MHPSAMIVIINRYSFANGVLRMKHMGYKIQFLIWVTPAANRRRTKECIDDLITST